MAHRRPVRLRDERGLVSTFVVVVTMACLLAAGLVLDGGRLVAGRLQAADVAGNAARAGAQQLVGLRAGAVSVDPGPATAAARGVLSAAGADGSVTVEGRSVTVTAHIRQSMVLLRIVGIDQRTVSASATARAEEGA
jgi:hypothetical protein